MGPRLQDSTIGGEWRNEPAVPKEEYGEAANVSIFAYCSAACKGNMPHCSKGRMGVTFMQWLVITITKYMETEGAR